MHLREGEEKKKCHRGRGIFGDRVAKVEDFKSLAGKEIEGATTQAGL
jgi:hypothetical protein